MEVLEGAGAIAYLNRLDNALTYSYGNRDNGLLHMMVEMQRSYLLSMMADFEAADNFAKLSIASTGFPELPSWFGDIRRGNSIFHESIRYRTQAFLPVLEQISQAQLGLSAESLTTQLSRDEILSAAFSQKRDKKQTELFEGILRNDRKKPVAEDIEFPGFLKVKYESGSSCLVKYIDDQDVIDPHPVLLVFNHPSYSKPDFSGNQILGIMGNESWNGEYRKLDERLRRDLVLRDYTGDGVAGFEWALSEIVHFNTLFSIFKEFSDHLIAGKRLDSKSYASTFELIHYQLRIAINNASSPEIRDCFEGCLNEQIKGIKQTSEDLSVGARGLIVRHTNRNSLVGKLWRKVNGWL